MKMKTINLDIAYVYVRIDAECYKAHNVDVPTLCTDPMYQPYAHLLYFLPTSHMHFRQLDVIILRTLVSPSSEPVANTQNNVSQIQRGALMCLLASPMENDNPLFSTPSGVKGE